MTLLAHLIPRVTDPEPAATQALAYLLRFPHTTRSLTRLLAVTGLESFHVDTIRAEERHSDGTPDLTLRDATGTIRVFIENKFWAGLTDAQPVSYLNELPPLPPKSALLFIVPARRMDGLWRELKRLCRDEQIPLGHDTGTDVLRWAWSGPRCLAITSWTHVLNGLALAALDDPAMQQDIAQLRALTEQMDAEEAFLPLRADEVTGEDAARRQINYIDLISEIVDRLVAKGIANKGGRSCSYHYAGRYLRLHGRFGIWLGVHLKSWRRWGLTPIWSEHNTDDPGWSGIKNGVREAELAFKKRNVEAKIDGTLLSIPIRLMTGVDRDRVIMDAVDQLSSIADTLDKAFPRAGGSGSPDQETN